MLRRIIAAVRYPDRQLLSLDDRGTLRAYVAEMAATGGCGAFCTRFLDRDIFPYTAEEVDRILQLQYDREVFAVVLSELVEKSLLLVRAVRSERPPRQSKTVADYDFALSSLMANFTSQHVQDRLLDAHQRSLGVTGGLVRCLGDIAHFTAFYEAESGPDGEFTDGRGYYRVQVEPVATRTLEVTARRLWNSECHQYLMTSNGALQDTQLLLDTLGRLAEYGAHVALIAEGLNKLPECSGQVLHDLSKQMRSDVAGWQATYSQPAACDGPQSASRKARSAIRETLETRIRTLGSGCTSVEAGTLDKSQSQRMAQFLTYVGCTYGDSIRVQCEASLLKKYPDPENHLFAELFSIRAERMQAASNWNSYDRRMRS